MSRQAQTVLVTGGAGYVGAALVPRLLNEGYKVKVLDLYLFGDDVLESCAAEPGLTQIKGDIRDQALLRKILPGCDAVIHLACISNDPCFELDPEHSKSINFDAFRPLVSIAQESRVKRFIYASTSSVYGVSEAQQVTEDHALLPITDYNKYKGLCEPILFEYQSPEFTTVAIRPATVCGYSPRQRLDLTVNILTNHALNEGKILVFGGEQMRPNIHIQDMVDLYVLLLNIDSQKIGGQSFNAGYQNQKVRDLAETVRRVVKQRYPHHDLTLEVQPSNDIRSYRICSEKIKRELGFEAKRTIEDAVNDLLDAFEAKKLSGSMTDDKYYNIRTMQKLPKASQFAPLSV
jgi:nucleoside-diphosphate-sugar epimerase